MIYFRRKYRLQDLIWKVEVAHKKLFDKHEVDNITARHTRSYRESEYLKMGKEFMD